MDHRLTRRHLLQAGLAAGAVGLTRKGLAQDSVKTVRMGFIGVGIRGTSLLKGALRMQGVVVPAICDIREERIQHVGGIVEKVSGKRPEGYSKGPVDYRRMLQRDDLDAVLIATPMQLHAQMSADALRAGKHALSEVAAAVTLDGCWDIVRAAEETGKTYMLAENCCYYRSNLMVREMVRKGIFGQLTYAETGYVHDCRSLMFKPDGSLTWRGELSRDMAPGGNWYPTHSLGPVAQWLGINRGDRLVSLVSSSCSDACMQQYAAKRFGDRYAKTKFGGDSNHALIKTAKGAMIDLRFDVSSARPHVGTTYFTLQGTTASYSKRERTENIWIDGRTKGRGWEPASTYAKEFPSELWAKYGEEAKKTGHGGADFFVIREFLETVRTGRPSPIDAYDAAAWSCIIPLSVASVRAGGAPQEIPDFTKGKWKTRT